jgi:hypothetical protein
MAKSLQDNIFLDWLKSGLNEHTQPHQIISNSKDTFTGKLNTMTNRSAYHKSVSKPVTIRGVKYASCWQAAKAIGCSPQNVQEASRTGNLDNVGIRNKKQVNTRDS